MRAAAVAWLLLASAPSLASAEGFPLVVNECAVGSSGFIELLNRGSHALDVARDPESCWFVDDADGGGPPKLLRDDNLVHGQGSATCAKYPRGARCGVIAPKERVYVKYAFINAVSADTCRLVKAPRTSTGCGSAWVDLAVGGPTLGRSVAGASSVAGGAAQCYGRSTDGGAWSMTPQACSPGAPNGTCVKGSGCVEQIGATGLLLLGTVLTPDAAYEGEVLVVGDTIRCAAASCQSDPAAATATRVQTRGIILPGMIDAHNHVQFDIFDESDWAPEASDNFTNHNQWPNRKRYKAVVDAKQYLNGETRSGVSLGCELLKYGELKALIAGTTSVVGAAIPANKACYGSLARTIDQGANGLPHDRVQAATLFPRDNAEVDAVCKNFANGRTSAYLIHIAEGVDDKSMTEFDRLLALGTTPGCLFSSQTSVVHGTSLREPHFRRMAQAGMGLVWSPRSNVFLYGRSVDLTKTTDIPAALEQGVAVALAPDWSIGGSQNLLDELRFADRVDEVQWGDAIPPEQLVQMVTSRPAEILGLSDTLGRIEPGFTADLTVIAGDPREPYASVLAATPESVRLVLVGGEVLYGDADLRALAKLGSSCEALDVCASKKFLCVARPEGTATDKLAQTYREIRESLDTGLQRYDELDLTPWDFSPIAELYRCPQ